MNIVPCLSALVLLSAVPVLAAPAETEADPMRQYAAVMARVQLTMEQVQKADGAAAAARELTALQKDLTQAKQEAIKALNGMGEQDVAVSVMRMLGSQLGVETQAKRLSETSCYGNKSLQAVVEAIRRSDSDLIQYFLNPPAKRG